MGYECPRCDKPLRDEEVDNKKCSNCNLEFRVTKETDVAIYQEKALVKKLAQEVFGIKGTKLDYYKTAINMIKGCMKNVVCTRGKECTTFFRVGDAEIMYHLFRIYKNRTQVAVEFDIQVRYKGVINFNQKERKARGLGRWKSTLRTKDLEYFLEVCMAVAERKNNYCGSVIQTKEIRVCY